jgi:DNA-binding MarR family transcriptional regulator
MRTKNIGRWIAVLYRQFQIYLNLALKDLEVNSAEYSFLVRLLIKDGVTQEKLSSALLIDKAATARAVRSLEEKGYVIRYQDTYDKRANQVYVTSKAKASKDKIFSIYKNWTNLLTEDMDPKTVGVVFDALQSMCLKVSTTDFKDLLKYE